MRELNKEEMMEVNGGFGSISAILEGVHGLIGGIFGMISSFF